MAEQSPHKKQTTQRDPDGHSAEGMSSRKAAHLAICTDEDTYDIEGGDTRLGSVRLVHHALPEVSELELDTSVEFLGKRLRLPFFISSMTGGSEAGYKANKELARIAQAEGLAVGMGSIRILFRKPEVFEHFTLKQFAPDVPVIANLGGVQVRDMVHANIVEMLKRLEVDAIAVHLNPGQELFQPEGDRDFRGILDAIRRFCAVCPVPVIVKETGCGLHPLEVLNLIRAGVRYVNIAGSGGTNWISVESHRLGEDNAALREAASEFSDWGNPTGLVLASLRQLEDRGRVPQSIIPPPNLSPTEVQRRIAMERELKDKTRRKIERPRSEGILGGRIIASGGIRTGMDVVKSLVLGARVVGTALPFIRTVQRTGVEGGRAYVQRVRAVLRSAMVMTNVSTIAELRKSAYLLKPDFAREVEDFSRLFD